MTETPSGAPIVHEDFLRATEGKEIIVIDPFQDKLGNVDLMAPSGSPIIGTLEDCPARADLRSVYRTADGKVLYDWDGATKMFYDDQATVVDQGHELFVDDNGETWRADQLVSFDDEADYVPPADAKPWAGTTNVSELLATIRDLLAWNDEFMRDWDDGSWKRARKAVGITEQTPKED